MVNSWIIFFCSFNSFLAIFVMASSGMKIFLNKGLGFDLASVTALSYLGILSSFKFITASYITNNFPPFLPRKIKQEAAWMLLGQLISCISIFACSFAKNYYIILVLCGFIVLGEALHDVAFSRCQVEFGLQRGSWIVFSAHKFSAAVANAGGLLLFKFLGYQVSLQLFAALSFIGLIPIIMYNIQSYSTEHETSLPSPSALWTIGIILFIFLGAYVVMNVSKILYPIIKFLSTHLFSSISPGLIPIIMLSALFFSFLLRSHSTEHKIFLPVLWTTVITMFTIGVVGIKEIQVVSRDVQGIIVFLLFLNVFFILQKIIGFLRTQGVNFLHNTFSPAEGMTGVCLFLFLVKSAKMNTHGHRGISILDAHGGDLLVLIMAQIFTILGGVLGGYLLQKSGYILKRLNMRESSTRSLAIMSASLGISDLIFNFAVLSRNPVIGYLGNFLEHVIHGFAMSAIMMIIYRCSKKNPIFLNSFLWSMYGLSRAFFGGFAGTVTKHLGYAGSHAFTALLLIPPIVMAFLVDFQKYDDNILDNSKPKNIDEPCQC